MNLLLLGSGGREHALAWKLRQSPTVGRLHALPGSAAMAAVAEPLAGDPLDAAQVLAAVEAYDIGLTVIGPEAPLAAGVSDALQARGHAVFGPSRAAARLETSKIFAKQFMQRHAIPTAGYAACDSLADARRALGAFQYPVVIKADGLAAGKGVVIAATAEEAQATLAAMFAGDLVGSAGSRVVLEEFLEGEEVSLLALADGRTALAMVPAQDHKRIFDGDRGPNTGGMGAVSLDTLLSAALRQQVATTILEPTLRGMAAEGNPFHGVLYCGLMLTKQGPKVLEYNVRFGDPETQALMLRLDGDLAPALAGAAAGKIDARHLQWSNQPSACVVLASEGYPGTVVNGREISGLTPFGEVAVAQLAASGVQVFHAGTRREGNRWLTQGGRVLSLVARAGTLSAALELCYAAAGSVTFPGCQLRRDIGWRHRV
ncbi:MAG: phosphoribosylamine--glycine ligase [Terriglobales bacterium]